MNLCVFVSFLIYNTFTEIDEYLGEGTLRRLFFSKPDTRPAVST